jgi:hypothetical protein
MSTKPTLAAYVEVFGTDSQRERFAAGALPEAEADSVVYAGILKTFGGRFYKRRRLDHSEVRELAMMHRKAGPDDLVTFEVVEPADEFSVSEWATLQALKKSSEDLGAKVEPFWVIAHCGEKHLRNAYARVIVRVGEQDYRTEWCLN